MLVSVKLHCEVFIQAVHIMHHSCACFLSVAKLPICTILFAKLSNHKQPKLQVFFNLVFLKQRKSLEVLNVLDIKVFFNFFI